nr:hypothetical protein [Tanacetum cinerariifolium]
MTDYALWEVILNGDSPLPTRTIKSVETPYPPTTVEEKLSRKNELKAKGTLLMALPNEHHFKFNSYKTAKFLMEAIEKRFGDLETLSMDDLYNNLKIYEAKVIRLSSITQNTQNVAFVTSNNTDNTNKSVNTAHGISAASFKTNAFNLPIGDGLKVADGNVNYKSQKIPIENRKGSRKCKASKHQDNRNREAPRRTVPVKDTTSNALVTLESVTSLPDIEKSKVKTSEKKLKNVSAPIIKDWVSDSEDEDKIETESKQIKPSFAKEKFIKSTEHVKSPKKTVKHPSSREAVSVNTARPINTAYPRSTVNGTKPSLNVFHKSHSPIRRTFNQRTAPQNSNLKETISTAKGNPQYTLQDQGIFDSRFSRHMTGNKSFLTDYQEIDGRFIAFGGSPKGGKLTRKGKIRTGKLGFEDVYFVKELKFNLFFVSQMCDKKNSVLFTKTECLVLSPDFKLLDENQVLLKVPKQNNMYSFDLKIVAPLGGLTCLFTKAIIDESNLWHMRLRKESSTKPPSLNKKIYCLVIADEFSRFSWVFFLAFKDETSGILKSFITCIENQLNHKVKIIRCNNRTEFKNSEINQFCQMKGIKREFSVARTSQQNGVAKRKNRTLIEAARTTLADLLLPTTFWAEAVNTACYVQNRVLVTKPHNKTPYELLIGISPNINFMKPFGYPVTILNTLDHLGKFKGMTDEGFLVGYSVNSKAFRVFNSKTRKVEENLHIKFLENKSNVAGRVPEWLFDIDSLTNSMNYEPVTIGNQIYYDTCIEINVNAWQDGQEKASDHEYILLPFMPSYSPLSSSTQSSDDKDVDEVPGKGDEDVSKGSETNDQERTDTNTQDVNTIGLSINIANTNITTGSLNINIVGSIDPSMPSLEEIGIFDDVYDDREVGAEDDTNNL